MREPSPASKLVQRLVASRVMVYVLAVAVTLGALWVRLMLSEFMGDRPVVVLFLLPIILSAYAGGLGPGLVSTMVAAGSVALFVIPSQHIFRFERPVDFVQWLLLVATGVVVSVLIESLHQARVPPPTSSASGKSQSTERKVRAGFGFALTCLAAIGIMSYVSVSRLREDAAALRRSDEVVDCLHTLLSTVTDAETAQRGYTITGESDYLEPYRAATSAVEGKLQVLKQLRGEGTGFRELTSLVKDRMDFLGNEIEVRRDKGFTAAQAMTLTGEGKRLHDHIRLSVAKMIADEKAQMKEREDGAAQASTMARIVIVTGGMLAFVVVAVALFTITRDFSGGRQAERALSEAKDLLEMRVTERTKELQKRNAELGESERRYRGLAELSPHAIFINRDNRIVFINEAGLKLLRASSRDQVLGRSPLDFFHPETHEAIHERITRMMEKPLSVPLVEEKMVLVDGTVIDAEVAAASFEDSGRLVIQVVCKDITEHKQAELAAGLMTAIVESSDDAIIGKQLDGIVTSWNQGAERMFGYTAAEMIGVSIKRLIPADRLNEETEILDRISRGEHVRHFETVRLRKGGELVDMSVTVSPIKNSAGRVVGASKIAHDISDQKRANAKLAAERKLLRTLIDVLPESIYVKDTESRFLVCNETCASFTGGPSAAELIGKTDHDFHRPDLAEEFRNEELAVLKGETMINKEISLPQADGSRRILVSTKVPLHDGNGNIVGIVGTGRDITQRKLAEEALRASEHRFRTTLDNLMEGCQIIGRDWAYIYINEAAAGHNRRPAQGMIGRTIMECFPDIELTAVFALMRVCMDGEPVQYMETEFIYPDGASAWFHLIIQAVPEGIFILSSEITERKLAERRLATQGAVSRVLAAADSLHEATPLILGAVAESEGWDFGALWELDEEAGVLRCRETWHRQGVAADELAAKTKEITFARGVGLPGRVWDSGEAKMSPDVAKDSNYLRAPLALRTGFHSALAFPILQGEGKVIGVIDFLAVKVRESDEKLTEMFGLIGRQIGLFIQRRHAEDQVRLINAQLEQRVTERTAQLQSANKELEAFSYSVSHDLRAPLRTVDGYSQAVLEDYAEKLPDEGRRYLQTIRKGAQQMGELIDDLLRFARLSRAAMEVTHVDMNRLVKTALSDLRFEDADGRITIKQTDLPSCTGDASLLRQVWVNLLSNALKYSGRREKALIEIGCLKQNGESVYFVRDNGAGFDMRYADKLFGVFQRLHRAEEYEGTGVGLAIVQRVVHRHGGRVWAEAEENRGATFYFTLEERKPS